MKKENKNTWNVISNCIAIAWPIISNYKIIVVCIFWLCYLIKVDNKQDVVKTLIYLKDKNNLRPDNPVTLNGIKDFDDGTFRLI